MYSYILHLNDLQTIVNKVKLFLVSLCVANTSIKQQSFVDTQLNDQTVLFRKIQFKEVYCLLWVLMSNSSNRPIDKTLLGASPSVQSGLGKDANERVFCIPQSSSNSWASPLDWAKSYLGNSLSVDLTILQRYSEYIQKNKQTGLVETLISETESSYIRQIHLPRKQRQINRKGHRNQVKESMDSYQ